MYLRLPFIIFAILLIKCHTGKSTALRLLDSSSDDKRTEGSYEEENEDEEDDDFQLKNAMKKDSTTKDIFYPVADDNDTSIQYLYFGKNSRTPQSNTRNSSTDVQSRSFDSRGRTPEILIKEIKMLFDNYGYRISDFPDIFRSNSSLFLQDSERSSTLNLKSGSQFKVNSNSNYATSWSNNDQASSSSTLGSGVDEHSLIEYKKRIRMIFEKNRNDSKSRQSQSNQRDVISELGELMRVIREIEYDDFSEVLNLIKSLNQGYGKGNEPNSTILIAMIQAAVQQWEDSDGTLLPPPFGTRNPTDPIDIPPELRDELLELSNLLTNELKTKLIEILAKDQSKSPSEIAKEIATVEEDEEGNVTIYVQSGNLVGGKATRETFLSKKPAKIIIDAHKEEGNDKDDDFTITEELVLDDEDDDAGNDYDDATKSEASTDVRRRQEREKPSLAHNKKNNQMPYRDPYLENIIRAEQERSVGFKMKRNENGYDYEYDTNKQKNADRLNMQAHRFIANNIRASRTKRVRKSVRT